MKGVFAVTVGEGYVYSAFGVFTEKVNDLARAVLTMTITDARMQ